MTGLSLKHFENLKMKRWVSVHAYVYKQVYTIYYTQFHTCHQTVSHIGRMKKILWVQCWIQAVL